MNQSLVLWLFSLDTLKWHCNNSGFNCSLEGWPGQQIMAAAFLPVCPTKISISCALLMPATVQTVSPKPCFTCFFSYLGFAAKSSCSTVTTKQIQWNLAVISPGNRFDFFLPQIAQRCCHAAFRHSLKSGHIPEIFWRGCPWKCKWWSQLLTDICSVRLSLCKKDNWMDQDEKLVPYTYIENVDENVNLR